MHRAELRPQSPKSEDIDPNKFDFVGPIKLQKKLRGSVKHALDDEVSGPINQLAYDENLNEVAEIGSEVEEIEGMSTRTSISSMAVDSTRTRARGRVAASIKNNPSTRMGQSAKTGRSVVKKLKEVSTKRNIKEASVKRNVKNSSVKRRTTLESRRVNASQRPKSEFVMQSARQSAEKRSCYAAK